MKKKNRTILIILLIIVVVALCSCQKEDSILEQHTFLIEEVHDIYHLNDGYTFDKNNIKDFYENSLFLIQDSICPQI